MTRIGLSIMSIQSAQKNQQGQDRNNGIPNMRYLSPLPTAISACLMLVSLGITDIAQAVVPDQSNIER